MNKTCVKCGATADVKNLTPLSACPVCGAIYSRAEEAAVRPPARSRRGSGTSLGALPLIAALALVAAGIGGTYLYERHAERAKQDELDSIVSLMRKWDDAVSVAQATPRIALSGPVQRMQDIRMETQALTPAAACTQTARDALVRGQDATLHGFLGFMSQQSTEAAFELATDAMVEVTELIRSCRDDG